jgi:SNF2 family DNA or RNA helicase
MYPAQYRSYWKFFDQFVEFELIQTANGPYRKVKGVQNEAELLAQIDPFYVRHLKREQCCPWHPEGVMPWLPEKYYSTVWAELTSQQRKAYTQMEKDMLSWVGEHEDEPLAASVVVAQIVRLQQFSMAYASIEGGRVRLAEPSSKLDALCDILEETLDNHEPIVVFSQFSQAINLLAARLERMGSKVKWGTYTGQNRKDRDDVKRAFAAGDLDVFAGTIQAGGEAIDGLQNYCSTMVFLDRTWSSSANMQAEDRLDRDGQTKPVHIIDIVARNTVDLGRRQKLEMQWAWIRRILGDEKGQIQHERTQEC